jgi:hypothetical protein
LTMAPLRMVRPTVKVIFTQTYSTREVSENDNYDLLNASSNVALSK